MHGNVMKNNIFQILMLWNGENKIFKILILKNIEESNIFFRDLYNCLVKKIKFLKKMLTMPVYLDVTSAKSPTFKCQKLLSWLVIFFNILKETK